jgi:TfoX/Sxy family transcriptional regulator of competence genes
MAWVKIPKENHPILLAALPKDPRVRTVQMFGAVCGLVNGHIFAGLFGRSAIVRLAPDDLREALALDGAEPFDPMGNKRVMADTVLLPETVMDEPGHLRDWIARGFGFTAALPPKQKKRAKKPAAKSSAAKAAAKTPAVKSSAVKKAASKSSAAKKAAAKTPAAKKPAAKKSATK